MSHLLHHLIETQAQRRPQAQALRGGQTSWTYAELAQHVEHMASGLGALGLERHERVAVWLPKSAECVALLFAISRAGGVLVPIHPLLKPAQAIHIIKDSGARVLITQKMRLESLEDHLPRLHDLRTIITLDAWPKASPSPLPTLDLDGLLTLGGQTRPSSEEGRTENDLAALLYTSGSTGHPKGVMLSHRNFLAGASSVASYLALQADDRLLAVLPFSFDYGFSQLTVAFHVGASVTPLDYLLPNDLRRSIDAHAITVLAGVPTLWQQLAAQAWLPELTSLRVLTNSGGRLPRPTIERLRTALPKARLFLMYGLTEAFRSTFLPPEEIERRPDAIGRAIPNAEVHVLRPDGSPCAVREPGELVHRGPTVALGYWNDPVRTAERFRPWPLPGSGLVVGERAVWSGDRVFRDEEGFIYFIGRDDDMIKSSGYRISPTEIEEVLYACGHVREAAVIGVDDAYLGQRIVAVVTLHEEGSEHAVEAIMQYCRAVLPFYMHPQRIEVRANLPHTPHGKVDRRALREELTLRATAAPERP